ncbi:MAG: hypothetical protein ABW321_30215 [Polyangiales bacterium]
MLTRYVTLVTCLIAMSVGVARAQDPTDNSGGGPARNFGLKGQLAFSSDNTLNITRTSEDSTYIAFAPAADYFIIDGFSIGGTLGIDYSNVRDADTTRFTIGPRVGYNLSFTNMLGIWPKLGFAFAHSSTSVDVDDNTEVSTSNSAIALNLFVPVMFHPVTHFFLGLGPYLDTDLSGDNRVTQYGVKLTVGGWLD